MVQVGSWEWERRVTSGKEKGFWAFLEDEAVEGVGRGVVGS